MKPHRTCILYISNLPLATCFSPMYRQFMGERFRSSYRCRTWRVMTRRHRKKISKEKNINLNVALKLGNLIKENCDDVKGWCIPAAGMSLFLWTDGRNSPMQSRPLSVHTNALANNRTAKGAATWTLGLAKSDANLEVAKRENSVILYENDYQTRYAGFNPNSAESYIIFEFMQDKYMEQSVHLASLVQKQFPTYLQTR